jgi:hypothetical protein
MWYANEAGRLSDKESQFDISEYKQLFIKLQKKSNIYARKGERERKRRREEISKIFKINIEQHKY